MREWSGQPFGGAQGQFPETDWSEIRSARTQDDTFRRIIMDNLVGKYWKPVYCYVRRRGHHADAAEDLVQGFFHEVVLGRQLVQRADRVKGRFRRFLLTALERYLKDAYRTTNAEKRGRHKGIVSLDAEEMADLPSPWANLCPEQAFHYAWAADLLDQVLVEIRDEYQGAGRFNHWNVFQDAVLSPIRDGREVPALADLCKKYGIEGESTASNMLTVVKRRFRGVLRRRLRILVHSEEEVDQEFNELLEILSKGSAG